MEVTGGLGLQGSLLASMLVEVQPVGVRVGALNYQLVLTAVKRMRAVCIQLFVNAVHSISKWVCFQSFKSFLVLLLIVLLGCLSFVLACMCVASFWQLSTQTSACLWYVGCLLYWCSWPWWLLLPVSVVLLCFRHHCYSPGACGYLYCMDRGNCRFSNRYHH